MLTYVQTVNRVLRRLREDTVTNYNDTDYSTLIGDLVNETVAEMQGVNGVEWNSLLDDHTITTDGSSRVYALTSTTSENSRDTNELTRILGVYNDTDDFDLVKAPYQWVSRQKLYTTESSELFWWREKGVDATGRQRVEVWPEVASKTVVVATYNPHKDIASNDTLIRLPQQAVILGTYARAVDERGEDAGTSATAAWGLYRNQLGQALLTEADRGAWLETDWRPE